MAHTLDELFALGFESNVGHLDFRGVNYGRVVDGVPVLTQEGIDMLAEMDADAHVAPAAAEPKAPPAAKKAAAPAAKKAAAPAAKKSKAAAAVPAPEPPPADDGDLGATLSGLLGE